MTLWEIRVASSVKPWSGVILKAWSCLQVNIPEVLHCGSADADCWLCKAALKQYCQSSGGSAALALVQMWPAEPSSSSGWRFSGGGISFQPDHIYLADYTTHKHFHQLHWEHSAKKWRDSPFDQKCRFLSSYADCKSALKKRLADVLMGSEGLICLHTL